MAVASYRADHTWYCRCPLLCGVQAKRDTEGSKRRVKDLIRKDPIKFIAEGAHLKGDRCRRFIVGVLGNYNDVLLVYCPEQFMHLAA